MTLVSKRPSRGPPGVSPGDITGDIWLVAGSSGTGAGAGAGVGDMAKPLKSKNTVANTVANTVTPVSQLVPLAVNTRGRDLLEVKQKKVNPPVGSGAMAVGVSDGGGPGAVAYAGYGVSGVSGVCEMKINMQMLAKERWKAEWKTSFLSRLDSLAEKAWEEKHVNIVNNWYEEKGIFSAHLIIETEDNVLAEVYMCWLCKYYIMNSMELNIHICSGENPKFKFSV
jgi:hypothetical protein